MSKLFSYELISEGLADERLLENGFALSPRIVKKKLERLLEAEQQLKDYREFIEKNRPKHAQCDDSYYNCKKLSYDGTIYDDEECSCGADETNLEIDKLLKGDRE